MAFNRIWVKSKKQGYILRNRYNVEIINNMRDLEFKGAKQAEISDFS